MPEDIYWQKYAARFKSFPSVLKAEEGMADMAVCIPVFAEPDLIVTLDSIWDCERPDCLVDVLICFNKNDQIAKEELAVHDETWKQCNAWVEGHPHAKLRFSPIYYESLPDPKGGVGWARKMVMDEAARHLAQDGIILCLDGDCTIERNYLVEVYKHFLTHPKCEAASIYYEHRFDALEGDERNAIIDYELHLRYLVHALRWTGHPFAYQTVGSSMAVRRSGYLVHGGMNTRKAGEDFYFLQKFIEVGTLQEIKTTTVYPSARISYRVPFGTGRAMSHLLTYEESWMTTSFTVYQELKLLLSKINRFRQICIQGAQEEIEILIKAELTTHPELTTYLDSIDFYNECVQIVQQTASPASFRKRFFRYLNAFKVMRYSHFMRDHYYPDVYVEEAVRDLISQMEIVTPEMKNTEDYLKFFRNMDKDTRAAYSGTKQV